MTTHRDHLDEAIDAVAARLTRVADNDALAARIVDALPERSIWHGWLWQSWAPRLAVIAVVVVAGVMWMNREHDVTPGAPPLASVRPDAPVVEFVAAVRELEPNRTQPLEPLEPVEPLEPSVPRSDFERALPAIDTLSSLELDALAPARLAEDAPLTVAPLSLADLPLAPEPDSQR